MNLDLSPLAAMVADLVAERVAKAQPVQVDVSGSDLDLWRAYTAEEAGARLGLTGKAVYNIPEALLPRTHIGSTGRAVRFLGIHLLCYLNDLPQPDVKAIADSVRRRFVEQASTVSGVRSIRTEPLAGRQRVH